MRAIPTYYLFFFISFYLLTSFAAFKCVTNIESINKIKRLLIGFFIGVTILILLFFFILFIWPNNVRIVEDYSYYLIFNAIFSIDVASKIPLAISYLFGFLVKPQKRKVAYYAGIIFSIPVALSILYGAFFGSREFKVHRIEVEYNNLPPAFDGYQIAQISDLHLGSFFNSRDVFKDVFKKVKDSKPDIILFTGDLVNNFSNETFNWEKTFKSLTENSLCYSITGNHDYGNYTDWVSEKLKSENHQRVIDAHKSFGFTILNNENVKIIKGKDSIFITGVENWGHPPFPQYANMEKAMAGIPDNAFTIMLSHDPAHWDEVIKFRKEISLTLSGHTHGMQWGISRAGFRFSLSYFVRRQWAGLYRYNDNYLNVNLGLGMVAIPWRINMPPEISIISLKRVKVN